METLIIFKDHHFSYFAHRQPLLKGDKATRISEEKFEVSSPTGERKGEVGAEMIYRIAKKPASTNMWIEIGKQIRRGRDLRGLNQTEAASLLRVSKVYLCNLENGRTSCSIERLKKICDILNCDLQIKIKRKYDTKNEQATEILPTE